MSPRPARSVLVVDGANVVGSVPDGWWKDRAGAARRLHEQLVTLQEEERADIARDLHDEVGPFLFTAALDADVANTGTVNPVDRQRLMEEQSTLENTYGLLQKLRHYERTIDVDEGRAVLAVVLVVMPMRGLRELDALEPRPPTPVRPVPVPGFPPGTPPPEGN